MIGSEQPSYNGGNHCGDAVEICPPREAGLLFTNTTAWKEFLKEIWRNVDVGEYDHEKGRVVYHSRPHCTRVVDLLPDSPLDAASPLTITHTRE